MGVAFGIPAGFSRSVKLTIINIIRRKENNLVQVNPAIRILGLSSDHEVRLEPVCDAAELDEQWSFVDKTSNQRWLWHAVDHSTNTVLAYVFGIQRFYTDDWGAYERNLDEDKHEVGKRNTQKIERKNLNFRTWIKRLARKTICFSKLEKRHDIVIGLLINKVEFGVDIYAKTHI